MPTPHIAAADGDFAPVCLMPGDPRRARHIARTHLSDARLVTDIRNMEGYTGTFDAQPVSVMAHGMGIPSVSIYATELVRGYGVTTLVRVGPVFTSDLFYAPDPAINERVAALGMLAVEMETAGLYGVAAETGARALAVLTVSDHLGREEHLPPAERESSFDDMVQVALGAAVA